MKDLKNDIKNKSYKNLYLFCGEEHFLIKHYENEIKKRLIPPGAEMMNLSIFQGKAVICDEIMDSCETLPFFNDYRLVIARDTGLFALGRKDESDKMSKYIKDIPETAVVVFIETDVDKRNSLYKSAVKIGKVVEFKTPSERDLLDWIVSYCKKRDKIITNSTAVSLLRMVANDMDSVSSELEKLIAYKGGEAEILPKDISFVCNQSVESKIFDLVAAIGNKKAHIALDVFANLLQMKESPVMVLIMIARQFRIILQCKHLSLSENNLNNEQIAERLGIRSFIVRECLNQAKNFKLEALKKAYESCLDTDVSIKTGKMDGKLAVEMLILSI